MSADNDRRADRAFKAIDAYVDRGSWGPDIEQQIIDLFTDLHHLLARNNEKAPDDALDQYLRVAHDHYFAEKVYEH